MLFYINVEGRKLDELLGARCQGTANGVFAWMIPLPPVVSSFDLSASFCL